MSHSPPSPNVPNSFNESDSSGLPLSASAVDSTARPVRLTSQSSNASGSPNRAALADISAQHNTSVSLNTGVSPNMSGASKVTAGTGNDVIGLRWLAQSARPARLTDVDFGSLPVELRLLLIHDGTLTTALEAYQLAPITADVEGQDDVLLEPDYASWLQATPGAPAVRRNTILRHRITGRLLVQCEVHLLVERLPDGFLEVLANCDKGLGAAFGQLKIETRRELLWYGRSPMAGLSDLDRLTSGDSGVARGYRLILGSTPICCIEEAFPDAVIHDSSEALRPRELRRR